METRLLTRTSHFIVRQPEVILAVPIVKLVKTITDVQA